MADIGLSAFSLFFMQSEFFLSYQRGLEEGRKTSNCRSLFGMTAIPTDNHIRAMLDPVPPSHLQAAFDGVLETLRRRGGLAPFQRLGGRVLIALDGTEYFCSQKLGCPHCLTRKRSNGKIHAGFYKTAQIPFIEKVGRLRTWRPRIVLGSDARVRLRETPLSACA